eukprot:CAMPEP_0179327504 /NCGR_PEP_ID=MMETSP0797-20121207/61994_1 /TAXON_ID=47934 /ORGANISM="Dinophysis acuminata, Strain DAEP01" /LENGTH=33 /DNA_ID= /DNA_START= /DNA_END= /DNA_ORIENTATION=
MTMDCCVASQNSSPSDQGQKSHSDARCNRIVST